MKKKDIFIQENAYSCGACSIASIISYHGGHVPLETILEDTYTSTTGTNAYSMIEALKGYNFNAYGLKIPLDKIDKNLLPVIAHTVKNGYEHFLVIYKIDKDEILTMDPECGRKKYKYDEFSSMYKDTVLIATPLGEIPKYKEKSLLLIFLPLLHDVKAYLALIIFIYIISLALNLLLSFHLKFLNLGFDPLRLTIMFIVIRILSSMLDYRKNILIENILKYIDQNIFKTIIRHIFFLPDRILKNRRVGEIVSKIENTGYLKDLFLRITIINTMDILSIFVTIIIMCRLSLKLTLIYVSILICYLIYSFIIKSIVYKNEKHTIKLYDEYSGKMVEYLDGIKSIKNLNKEEIFICDLNNTFINYVNDRAKKDKSLEKYQEIKLSIFGIGTILVNLVGFNEIGLSITFLDLITLSSLYGILFSSIESISDTLTHFMRCKAIYRSISEFYALKTEKQEKETLNDFSSLTISNLSYSYNKFKNTINDFSYNIKRGDKILITGPSGIGKSTLVKCLSGSIYDYKGEIHLNDKNIKSMSPCSIREYITYITQEEKLFMKSIKDNITLGTYDEEKFKNIVNIIGLNSIFDKRVERENSMLLEGAINMSGGERDKIILARALYMEPSILIIDETLSSVSIKDEDEILNKLLKMDDLSLIYITHRKKEKYFSKIINFRKDATYEIKERRTNKYKRWRETSVYNSHWPSRGDYISNRSTRWLCEPTKMQCTKIKKGEKICETK